MKKLLLVLAVGLVVGYFYGFRDARDNERNIVSRAVQRIGGKGEKYTSDIDQKLETVERGR